MTCVSTNSSAMATTYVARAGPQSPASPGYQYLQARWAEKCRP
jgi:hypothetical protein